MRISDWSSDVCSSDLHEGRREAHFELVDPPHHRAACDLAVLEANVDARRQGGRWEVVGIDVRDDPNGPKPPDGERSVGQIGRASCRERVGQYVMISVVAVSIKNKNKIMKAIRN